MKINTCMKCNVVFIPESTTIGEAAALMVEKHIGILPVVDGNNVPVGIVRIGNLMTLEMPDFINLVEDVDFVHDFGAVETSRPSPEALARTVNTVMEPVLTIEEDSGLLRAYAIMIKDNLYDLPVVNAAGLLTGVVSQVDIGTAILAMWPVEGSQ